MHQRRAICTSAVLAVILATAAVSAVPAKNSTVHKEVTGRSSSSTNSTLSSLPTNTTKVSGKELDATVEGIDASNHSTKATSIKGRSLFSGTFGNTGLPSEILTLLARTNDEAEEDKVIDSILDSMLEQRVPSLMRLEGFPAPMPHQQQAAGNSEQAAQALLRVLQSQRMTAMNQAAFLPAPAPMMSLLRMSPTDQMNAMNAMALTRLPPKDLLTLMQDAQARKNAVETRQGGSCGNKRIDARFGAHGYMFSWLAGAPKMDWNNARAFCQSQCMDLVAMETPAENQFVKSIVDQAYRQGVIQYSWTAGIRSGGGFVWATSGAPIPGPGQAGSDWGIGGGGVRQPDNREGNENCMPLLNPAVYNEPSGQFTWHDVGCSYQKPFICEEV